MPKATYIQTNFTAGELSPRLEGRIDVAKYANGVQTLKNMLVYPHGGITRRGGTKYISSNKTPSEKVRLIPFQFNVSQSYVVEAGNLYMRFYRDGAPNAAPEIVTPYLESELFELQYVQSADVLFIVHPNHPPHRLSRVATNEFTLTPESYVEPPFRDENLEVNDVMGIILQPDNTVTASTNFDLFESGHVGSFLKVANADGTDYGIGLIQEYFNERFVRIATVRPFPTLNNQSFKWSMGAFSDVAGYPSSIAFFEQRLFYAGTKFDPQTIWGSRTNQYNYFDTGANDSDGLQYTIASDQVNTIRWLSSGKSLTIGTTGGEFLLSSSNSSDPVTPSNVKIVRQTEYGCEYVSPVRANGVVVFAQRSGRKVRQFTYQFESDSYTATDLSLLSEHITQNKIVEMDYQRTEDSTVWMVRGDGVLLGMSYERDQDVVGWHRQEIGGSSDSQGSHAKVESVCVIPAEDRDEVWVSVNRYVNGSNVRHIEIITVGRDPLIGDDTDDFFVDSGVVYDGSSSSTITGLDHLEGETVQVLADGAVQSSKTVSGGSITLDSPASKVVTGLPFESIITTMRIEAGSADGTSQGKIKRISEVTLRLYESLGMEVGDSPTNLETIPFRKTTDNMNSPLPRFTGDRDIKFKGGYDTDGRITVVQRQPLPLTILAIISRVRTNN